MLVVVPESAESTLLAAQLRAHGQEVWYPDSLPPGTDRELSLRAAFERCALVAVVLVEAAEEPENRSRGRVLPGRCAP